MIKSKFPPINKKKIFKWIIRLIVPLAIGAFTFGQIITYRNNRINDIQNEVNEIHNDIKNLKNDINNNFDVLNLRINKVYEDGIISFDDYQEYNKKQLSLIIDYSNSNKELLKNIIEINSNKKTDEIENKLNTSKNNSNNFQKNLNIKSNIIATKEEDDSLFYVSAIDKKKLNEYSNNNTIKITKIKTNSYNNQLYDIIYVKK